MSELELLNSLIDGQIGLIKKLEDNLFIEQLRLASLKSVREKILRQEIMKPDEENISNA